MAIERDDYLAHLAHDGGRMAEVARGDLEAPVPTCPEWTLKDLVEHTGQVHRWQTEACRVDAGGFPAPVGGNSAARAAGAEGGATYVGVDVTGREEAGAGCVGGTTRLHGGQHSIPNAGSQPPPSAL